MARPVSKGFPYFPHDTDASTDDKIAGLETLQGLKGYAVYFKILERIYHNGTGYMLLETELQKKVLAKALAMGVKELDAILNSCLEVGLFDKSEYSNNYKLVSNAILTRYNFMMEARQDNRERQADWQAKHKGDYKPPSKYVDATGQGQKEPDERKGNRIIKVVK